MGGVPKLESEIIHFFVRCGHSERLQNELEKMISPVIDKILVEEEISKDVLDVDAVVDTY